MARNLMISAAIFLVAFFVHINALKGGFVWDDQAFVVENNSIKKISNLPSFFYDRSTFSSKSSWSKIYRRPLRTASYAFEYRLWRLSPKGYHLTNLLIHGANAAAIFFLGLALSLGRWPAALGASIFAVHPVNTEAVAWISARADLMMTFFFILAFLFYLKEHNSTLNSKLGAFWPALFLSLSLLSKEAAVVFPVMTLVFHFAVGGKLRGRSFRKYLRLNMPLAAIVLIDIVFSRSETGSISEFEFIGGSWLAAAAIMVRGFAYYITLVFFPTALSADYSSVARIPVGFGLRGLISSFIVAGAISAAAAAWRTSRLAFFLALWFAVSLIPVSNIIVPLNYPIAERWLYLPMVGLALLSGTTLWRIGTREAPRRLGFKQVALACLAVIVIFNMGLLAARRTSVWRDEASLWADVGKRWPYNPHVHNNLGNSYLDKGDIATAEAYYRRAARLDPYLADPRYNLGNLYQISGRHDRAVAEYKSALLIEPYHAKALTNLGQALWQLGYLERAILVEVIAIEVDPRSSVARNNLGVALAERGYIDGAIDNYRKAIDVDADFAMAMSNLGDLYSQMGLINEAEKVLSRAVKLQPGLMQAHNNLGIVYGRRGGYDKAMAELKQAVLLHSGYALARRNLGIALKLRGLLGMALKEFELAVMLQPGNAENRLNLADIFLDYLGAKDKALFEISNAINIDRGAATSEFARTLIEKISSEARVRKLIDAK